jgi:hypothetical protein
MSLLSTVSPARKALNGHLSHPDYRVLPCTQRQTSPHTHQNINTDNQLAWKNGCFKSSSVALRRDWQPNMAQPTKGVQPEAFKLALFQESFFAVFASLHMLLANVLPARVTLFHSSSEGVSWTFTTRFTPIHGYHDTTVVVQHNHHGLRVRFTIPKGPRTTRCS